MDEIAGAIGTSKSIVYRYFTDRTGLQTAIGEAVLVDLGDALARATSGAREPHDVIASMVRVYLEMISRSPRSTRSSRAGRPTPGPVRCARSPMTPLPSWCPCSPRSWPPRVGHPGSPTRGAGGVIGFVRGAAEVWLQQTSHDADSRAGALEDLTDTITEWVCHGTSPSPVPVSQDHRGR